MKLCWAQSSTHTKTFAHHTLLICGVLLQLRALRSCKDPETKAVKEIVKALQGVAKTYLMTW